MFRSLHLAALLSACAFGHPLAPDSDTGALEWDECPPYVVAAGTRLECAYLSVPMDWEKASETGSVNIGIARLPAGDQEDRIGNLFFNPGGPGHLASLELGMIVNGTGTSPWQPEILDRFDIIGVDIRGSGLSDPVLCDPHLANEGAQALLYPRDQDSFDRLLKSNQALRQSCIDRAGNNLIDYMDTISIAKDYEAVRRALGDEPLTWHGQSYGTQLGTQYAELYPENVRAMLLDCSASLSSPETALFVEGGASADATLRYFFDWCTAQNASTCPAAHHNQSLEAIWTDLLDRAEHSPIPAKLCRTGELPCRTATVDADMIRSTTSHALTLPFVTSSGFSLVSKALYEAVFLHDASSFAALTLPVDSSPATIWQNSYPLANIAVTCQDWAHTENVSDVQLKQRLASSQFPLMKGFSPGAGFVHQCVGWPQPARNPPHKINIPESFNKTILMTSNLYDPATPYSMAVNLLQEIGEYRAVLVTRMAAGHTIFLQPEAFDGETVAAMVRYLVDLELPAQGTVFQS